MGVADYVGAVAEEQVLPAAFGLGTLVLGGAVSPSGLAVRRSLAVGIGVGRDVGGIDRQYLAQRGASASDSFSSSIRSAQSSTTAAKIRSSFSWRGASW